VAIGRRDASSQETQRFSDHRANLGRRPPDLSGDRVHRPADRSVETPVQGDDFLDLGRQRAQGLAQPFVRQGAHGGEIRPEAFRVGQPIGEGLSVIEERVQGQGRRAPWLAGALRRHTLRWRHIDDRWSGQALGPRP
jgi:hypothetical protein